MRNLLGQLIEIGDNKYVVTSVCESHDDNALPRAKVEMWKLPNKQIPEPDAVTPIQEPMYLKITELVAACSKLPCIKYLKEYFNISLIDARGFTEGIIILKHKGLNKFQIETVNKNIEQYGYAMITVNTPDKQIITI